MLERIDQIQNVGIFKRYNLNSVRHGDIEFSRLNIIYGKNSSGKSTIVDILRSLKLGNKDIIRGRASVEASTSQKVDLKIDNYTFSFLDTWDNSYPYIEIFDRQYILENIYFGNEISPENRRNQFNIIIGKDNIEISSQLIKTNDELRELNGRIKHLEAELLAEIKGDLSLKEFLV